MQRPQEFVAKRSAIGFVYPEFAAEVDRLSSMVSIASRDVLDWLKFAQSETDGIQLGLTDAAMLDAEIDRNIDELVEARMRERQLLLTESRSVIPSEDS